MLGNLFNTTLRSLWRNKAHTLLNLTGLALGITSSLIIFLIVRHEYSFDTFHEKVDRIYRITSKISYDEDQFMGAAPFPVGEAIKTTFPEVEEKTSIYFERNGYIKVGESIFKEEQMAYLEPSFFELFDFRWVAGDPAKALVDPYSMVLTESVAKRYFGENGVEESLGQVIQLNNQTDVKITGIMEDFPHNTDFPFTILVSFSTLKSIGEIDMDNWINLFGSLNHFILLKESSDAQILETQLPALLQKNMSSDEAAQRTLLLQPLQEVHFDDRFGNFSRRTPTKSVLLSFSLVGVFLLLTACINFINLTTAQGVKRSKEVGVRKVLGAGKSQLVKQFMVETLSLTVISVIVALVLTGWCFPMVLKILDLRVGLDGYFQLNMIPFLLGMTLVVTMLAGFYPALVLSGFKPIQSINNKFSNSSSNGGLTLRRGLIVFQFFITQLLIIGTLVVFKQLEYSKSQPLGFAKEAVITLQVPNDEPYNAQALRNQLVQVTGIQSVSLSLFSPSSQSNWEGGYNFPGSGNPSDFPVVMRPADHAYLQTFDIKLLAGRNILETDSLFTHVLANQALLRQMGIQNPQEAVGKVITVFEDETTIVGVVEDFHTHSLREPIKPTVLFNDPGSIRLAALKMDTRDIPATLTQVEHIFKEQFPESIFEYAYLDETIAAFYREEEKLSQLFMLFSGLAIFIGCLGLYGLISFMTVQRTKEMGVRKVLGASVHQIVFLFTKEFFVLILVAFALAAPLGWYLMKGWLERFVYKITWEPEMFFIAVGSTLLIAFLTVGYRSFHAALVNPVDTLRSE